MGFRRRRAIAKQKARRGRARMGRINPSVGRGTRLIVPGTHEFKRTVYLPAFTSVAGSNVFGALNFNLAAVPGASEFTALFDMYKISAVKVMFMPRGNSAEVGTNNNNGKMFTVLDYDDDTVPGAIDTLMQYEGLKTTSLTQDHTRYLKPKFARSIYQSAVTTAYGVGSGWIDCDSSPVPHYGVKYALQGTAGANIIDLKVTYYLKFKNVR